MTSLELRGVSKSYGRKAVLADVSHTFAAGLTLLIGPSGAGKSTLLRLIATAERPNRGAIAWEGRSGNGAPIKAAPAAAVRPKRRRVKLRMVIWAPLPVFAGRTIETADRPC